MNRKRVLLSMGAMLALLMTPLSPFFQPVQAEAAPGSLYVIPGGSPANSCLTVDTPCSLDEAMAHATDGTTIYLGEGTYTHYSHQNLIDIGPGKDINLKGGWYGHRHIGLTFIELLVDPVNHPSILDGQGVRRGIYIHGGVSPIIDGIKFTRGAADVWQVALCGGFDLTPHACGGGIFIYQASATIQNSVFFDNRAMMDGSGTLMGYGGGIFVESPAGQVLIQNSVFDSNLATQANDGNGGAIAVHGGPGYVTIYNNLFVDNVATYMGGAISAEHYDGTMLWIQANRFESNHALHAGAAIYLYYVDHAAISQNWFEGQGGNIGFPDNGTVDINSSGFTFSRNTLIDNEPDYGLKIYIPKIFVPTVSNNLFVRSGRLATIHVLGWGGASGTDMYTVRLKHNTLVSTGANDTLAVLAKSIACTVTNCIEAIVDNTILFKYGTGFSATSGQKGKITSDYTLFYQVTTKLDGYVLNNHEVVQPYAGFVDYLHDDYHLVRNAPARDKGKNAGITIDIDGDPRPLGGGYDVGADEFAYHTLLPLVRK